jgi:hypothetical protein
LGVDSFATDESLLIVTSGFDRLAVLRSSEMLILSSGRSVGIEKLTVPSTILACALLIVPPSEEEAFASEIFLLTE